MADWSVAKTHEWMMKALYDKYMEDEQSSIRWSIASALEATDIHPHGDDIVRECKRLADRGWVEILTQAYGYIFVRVTDAGRKAYESYIKEKQSDPSAVLSPK